MRPRSPNFELFMLIFNLPSRIVSDSDDAFISVINEMRLHVATFFISFARLSTIPPLSTLTRPCYAQTLVIGILLCVSV